MATIVSSETGEELNAATWADPKRYLWLLGLIVPLMPLMAFALVEATGLGVFWWTGPFIVYAVIPFLDTAIGKDAENPPDSAIKWLEQDRYYRWCTYAFLPLQYAALIFACYLWGSGDLSRHRVARPRGDGGDGRRHRDQHRARARPQAQAGRALAGEGRARADRLRPLLHRAQPRPPRPRRHARGPRELAPGRELLALPAAHGLRLADVGDPSREGAPRPPRQVVLLDLQRRPQRVGDDRRPVRLADRAPSASRSRPTCCCRRSSASPCSRSSTTSSTTGCCARSARTGATSAARRTTPGTPTTSRPTSSSTTCSATPTTTPTRSAATRRCAISRRRRSCRRATRR